MDSLTPRLRKYSHGRTSSDWTQLNSNMIKTRYERVFFLLADAPHIRSYPTQFADHWGDLAADPHAEGDAGEFQDLEKVDTEASREALRKAVEIRQVSRVMNLV